MSDEPPWDSTDHRLSTSDLERQPTRKEIEGLKKKPGPAERRSNRKPESSIDTISTEPDGVPSREPLLRIRESGITEV